LAGFACVTGRFAAVIGHYQASLRHRPLPRRQSMTQAQPANDGSERPLTRRQPPMTQSGAIFYPAAFSVPLCKACS